MGELFGGLGVLLGLFYVVGLPIIAFAALSRSARLREELAMLRAKLSGVEQRLKTLEAKRPSDDDVMPSAMLHATPEQTAAPVPEAIAPPPPASTPPADQTMEPIAEPEPEPVKDAATEHLAPSPLIATPTAQAARVQPAIPRREHNQQPEEASVFSGLISWFFHGNPVAKIGVLLLFFGLAYLFKFAVDHALFPIELRLAAAGAISLAVLGVGWKLRTKQALYSLILQGGGIGAFYITVFGAFRMYDLVPHGMAFALMILICAASVALAVLQNAQSLAVVASLGGYMAPVLLSTGSGNHVALFSYYALLSAGILAVSVWRAWRPLNLVGFLFTFGVATLWGWDNYRPELYVSSQLFLILNLLIFGILAAAFALRHQSSDQGFIDGTLVFGAPLVGFGLQYGITRHWEFGPAFSALGFAAVYLPLAYWLIRRWPQQGRRLAISFVALGGGFATLAIPLALSAQWTALAWALEGLGVLWAGLAQQHKRMAYSGTLLLVLAAVSAAIAAESSMDNTSFFLISGTLALTWLAGAYLWHRETSDEQSTSGLQLPLSIALWVGGIGAWLYCLANGAQRLMPTAHDRAALVALAGMSLSVLAWRNLSMRLAWSRLAHSVWLLWPFAALVLLTQLDLAPHPLASAWWNLTWLFAFAAALYLLRRPTANVPNMALNALHVSLLWGALGLLAAEVMWRMEQMPWGWEEWRVSFALVSGTAVLVGLLWAHAKRVWPIAAHAKAYLLAGLAPLACLLLIALFFGNLLDGALPNWHYIPLINPLEETAAFALLAMTIWRQKLRRLVPEQMGASRLFGGVLIAALAWWLNGALLRALAYYGEVPWTPESLWDSRLIQTVFALTWTLAALALMWMATRRASRAIWYGGACLLAVVIAKLFLVDSAGGGGLERAIAFIGVAVLVLLIGYVAPLPPKRESQPAESAQAV